MSAESFLPLSSIPVQLAPLAITESMEQATVFVVLACAFILFVWEVLAVDIVGVLIILALVLTGILTVDEGLKGFGHPAVIGVGALFIVSEGLLRTGALGLIANRLERWSGGHEMRLMILVLIIVAVSSAFLNNTPVVAMFIPVVLGLSRKLGINPSHLLIPLSFAAILGGTCTLIGTSTNILVSSVVTEHGKPALGLFDFSLLGLMLVTAGIIYLLAVGRHLIPDRQTITSITSSSDRRLQEYVTELAIREGGELDGKLFEETFLGASRTRFIQLIRGEHIVWPPFDGQRLAAGDALIIAGAIQDLIALQKSEGLDTLDAIISEGEVTVESSEKEMAEILVLPNSIYVGQSLEEARFRSQFGAAVVAIQRHGMHLRQRISNHPLRVGDVLLVQGSHAALDRLASSEGLVLMTGVEDVLVRENKAPIAMTILAAVILLLSFSNWHMAVIALAGGVAMILTGCLPMGKIYESIHWRVLVLIAGTLALGMALEKTGAADTVAEWLTNVFRFAGPHGLVVVTLVLSALLTECISNAAVAALMVPIALRMPSTLESPDGTTASYLPYIMAVAYGASCSFLTPIGYQTNTLVYGAGGYRFTDFARVGIPLVLIIWTIGGIMIPILWPVWP